MGDWGVFVFDIIRFSGMSAGRVSNEKKTPQEEQLQQKRMCRDQCPWTQRVSGKPSR